MPERVELWWNRRRFSKGRDTPYRIGRFRSEWERYPMLIRQYHPELNAGITLTQIPPAAEVYLVWECDAGHRFVATPDEQRMRPGRIRRHSAWCPDCTALAAPKRVRTATVDAGETPTAGPGPSRPGAGAEVAPAGTQREGRQRGGVQRGGAQRVAVHTVADQRGTFEQTAEKRSGVQRARTQLPKTQVTGDVRYPVGEAFFSARAPKPASAAEADLRQRIAAALDIDLTANAVAVGRSFFSRYEVWPDIVIADLRVVIEYDTTGRDGLEHVGRREQSDRRKDQLLREAGWEVIRVRCGKLQAIGPYDVLAGGVSKTTLERVLESLRIIRGDLIVSAYSTQIN